MLIAGRQAPDFELSDLQGKSHQSSKLFTEGATLVVIFKSSCPVCQLALPFLERIKDSAALRIVLVSQDDAKTAAKFLDHFGISITTLLDGRGYPVSNTYEIETVPSLFLVDQGGVITKSWAGFSKADMEALGTFAGTALFRPGENVPLFTPG
jgi:peroxiredoxin